MMQKSIECLEKVVNKSPNPSENDEFAVFGRHVANELRQIENVRALRRAKLRIQQILCEAQESAPIPLLQNSGTDAVGGIPSAPGMNIVDGLSSVSGNTSTYTVL